MAAGPFYNGRLEPRERLLSALHEAQDHSGHNSIDPEQLDELRRRFSLTRAELRGVASYYSLFSLRPRGRHVIRVCVSPICRMIGSTDILEVFRQELGVDMGETTADGLFTLEETQCLGCCAGAPAMMVDDQIHGHLTRESVKVVLDAVRRGVALPASKPARGKQPRTYWRR